MGMPDVDPVILRCEWRDA